MSEGEELPPVVAALEGNDESFLAMLERDVAAAEQFSADLQAALAAATDGSGLGESGIGAALAGSVDSGLAEIQGAVDETATAMTDEFDTAAAESAQAWADAMDAGALEGRAAFDEAFSELGQMADEQAHQVAEVLAEAGQQGGAEFAAGLEQGMADMQTQVAALQEQLRQTEYQVFTLKNELDFGTSNADPWHVNKAPIQEATAATNELSQATGALTEEEIAFGAAFDDVYARMKAGELSAEQAMAALAGEEIATTATLSRGIAQVTGSWAQAQEALDTFGTSESQVAASTALLTDAEAELTLQNTYLLLAYQQLGSEAGVSIDSLQGAMGAWADAQAQVTAQTQALVAAQTEVNLAVIQNETAFMNETVALQDLAAASAMTGMDMSELAAEIEAGNYAVIAKAAADAKATLTSTQLAEAEQQLAAANLTLLGTFQRLAAGEEVSAEAQAEALAGVKSAESDVSALSGGIGQAGASAEKAAGSMSGFGASLMYGPLGMGLYAAMMVLPLLGGMFSSNAVSAAQFTQAVSQDSNAIGDNTAATIQQTLAKSNLSDISKTLGLSQAQLIEYAAGEKDVQAQVAAAYDATAAAMAKQAQGTAQGGYGSGREAGYDLKKLQDQKAALDAVTTAVAQAVGQDQANSDALLAAEQTTQIYTASVNALGSAQLLQVEQTQMSNQATAEYSDRVLAAMQTTQYFDAAVGAAGAKMLQGVETTKENNTAIVQYGDAVMGAYRDTATFNAALDASYVSMQISAQTSAQTSVGLLNLGDSQTSLNGRLVMSEDAYTQAQQGATAYGAALTSLNGTENSLLGTEAAFTTSLGGLTTSIKTNGDSLDVNTTKGAANITAITGIATAAQAAAVSVYQNDIATGNASKAYSDATTKLQQEKDAFITAADKAGLNKQAVQQLADELFKLPPTVTTAITANTQPAQDSVAALLASIDYSTAYVNVGTKMSSPQLKAAGGPVEAGQIYHVNEQGAEGYFVPPADGYIVPHDAMAGLGSGGGVGPAWGASGGAPSGGGGAAPQVTVHVYVDGREISAEMRADVQGYANHNGFTGFETTASRISR